ncbi:MAG: magnesium chelatase, partial [Firmicutes bacterium]|nr:magnesium chelatase [Bacillota bacterium]
MGTTEDRLLGSVNAGNLVEQGQWQLQQGLMAQADGGVLYIDEV